MYFSGFPKAAAVVLTLSVLLAGCKSAEERAEEYFQNGRSLIQAGDVDRGIVELRNVFQVDGSHREARRLLAMTLLRDRQDQQGAYSQLLRLIEQYPDDLDARIALSEIALLAYNPDEVKRHAGEAEALAPEDPRVQAIVTARDYFEAGRNDEAALQRDLFARADELLQIAPESEALRAVIIDGAGRDGDYQRALTELDWLLDRYPGNTFYWDRRLALLQAMEDVEGQERQLRDMVDRFPEDETHKNRVVAFYTAREMPEKAEAYLRDLAVETGATRDRLRLIYFLRLTQGTEVARAELDAAIAEAETPSDYQILQASFDFEGGARDTAIATLESLLQQENLPADKVTEARVTLARMLLATGDKVGARAQVEETLARDPTAIDALKMRASWQIENDDTDAAIASLRTALDQSRTVRDDPDTKDRDESLGDPEVMTLMAQAYLRSGRRELARDFFALAVEASGNGPGEAARYARILIDEERFLPAEDILVPALRRAPDNIDVIVMLGQVYLGMNDLDRVRQVVERLESFGPENPAAQQAATSLEAERIGRQFGAEDAMAYLESLATGENATEATRIALVRARLLSNDPDGALDLMTDMRAEDPDNLTYKAFEGAIEAIRGDLGKAETLYREVLDANPRLPRLWLSLSRVKGQQGEPAAARNVIDEALGIMPEAGELLWAKASYLEQDGEIDAAIDIYEALYAQSSASVIVANNLASLLATYKDDAESLERAWVVARRFRDAELPALQDTYGWIAHRRGDSQEALPYLESAAKGLTEDPIVQYHLAKVYDALDRPDAALEQFRRAAEIAGPADQRRQIEEARSEIERLEKAIAEAAKAAEN